LTDTPIIRATPTDIDGVVVVESTIFTDERGSFMTAFGAREMRAIGIDPTVAECHLVHNALARTLRGMHFQTGPSVQPKLVRCLSGAIYDVALDLRPESPTARRWVGVDLRAGDGRAIFVPAGCAHGYFTLADDTDILYLVGAAYDPARAGGVRWNDPAFGITWPAEPRVIAPRDATYPDYRPIAWHD